MLNFEPNTYTVLAHHQIEGVKEGEWITFHTQAINVKLEPFMGQVNVLVTLSQFDRKLKNRIVIEIPV